MSSLETDTVPSTNYYIRKTKWSPGHVVVSDYGPFEVKEDAYRQMSTLRKNKYTDFAIIEKESN